MSSATEPVVLGIESSCDETGVAVVRGGSLASDVVASSVEEHARFGGVIPEIASRAHLEAMLPTLNESLSRAEVTLAEVDAIAVTAGPGLVGSLTVGVSAAKSLALALDRPLYGINHVVGHLLVDTLVDGPFPDKVLALIVSGGHTNLVTMAGAEIVEVGATLDDAVGEAFDKVGRLLGLPFPGGPQVDRLAREGNKNAIAFPRGLTRRQDIERHPYDFSFSGLKTAVARWIEARQDAGQELPVADIAASFAEAVCDVLVRKTLSAAKDLDLHTLVVGGGFSANSQLRDALAAACPPAGIEVRIPPIRFCTDNGAMIAATGAFALQHGLAPSDLNFGVDSAMPLTQIVV